MNQAFFQALSQELLYLSFLNNEFLTEHFNLTEEVEMDDLTPDAEPNQAEEEDSDPEIRELEGKNKC